MISDAQVLLAELEARGNAVTSSYELARIVGVPQRTIGFLVSDLRQAGNLIGSIHGAGYFMISTEEELLATIEHIERRKAGIDRTVRALKLAWSQ